MTEAQPFWLEVDGDPPRRFHGKLLDAGAVATFGDALVASHELLLDASNIRSGTSRDGAVENASVTVTLRNQDGEATELLRSPPVGRPARLRALRRVVGQTDPIIVTLLAGVVQRVSLGESATIELVAGGTLPLNAPLPLRTSVEWGRFREAVPLPIRYGRTSGELVQYDESRRVWVWAGHAVDSITAVEIDEQPQQGWQFYNGIDSAGLPVAFIEFAQPIDEGAGAVAFGRGKVHPRTGAVMENPADVLWDVLVNVAGLPATEADFATFRADCAARSLVVGGSVDRADSAQSVASALCASVGAVYGPGVDGYAFVWPGGAVEHFDSVVLDRDWAVTADAALDPIANVVIINFDFAGGEPRGSIELEAPDCVAELGRRVLEIDAHWLTDARTAYDVAQRRLAHAARRQWSITATGAVAVLRGRAVAPGHLALVANARAPVAGSWPVMQVETDPATGEMGLQLAVVAGDAPRIRMVRMSEGIAALLYSSVAVTSQGAQKIITLVDEAGAPYAGVKVIIDGAIERFSDNGGRVVLPNSLMTPGQHSAEVVDGDRRFTVPLVIP